MEHSDEMTFAEYFKSRYDLFRGLISFAVAMQWLIDHDFAGGELYVLTLREWLDGQ